MMLHIGSLNAGHFLIWIYRKKKKKVDYQVELNQVKKLLPLNKGFVGKTVASRLNWVYPEPVLANLPSKLSVTEIKNRYYLLIGGNKNIVIHCLRNILLLSGPPVFTERRAYPA